MGEKVSKMKKGIGSNLVKRVEFDENNKLSGQEVIDLLNAVTSTGNKSVTQFTINKKNILTDEVASKLSVLLRSFHTSSIAERKAGSMSIHLSPVEFSSEGVNHILSSLNFCDIVGDLTIQGNSGALEESTISLLQELLTPTSDNKSKCALKRLELSGFAVSRQLVKKMAEVMSKQTLLTHVVLTKWELRIVELKLLLSGSPVFEILELKDNELNNDCCKVIAECLKNNTTLKKLDLTNNNITDDGVKHFIDLLKNSTSATLSTIILEDNDDISTSVINELEELVAKKQADSTPVDGPSSTSTTNDDQN